MRILAGSILLGTVAAICAQAAERPVNPFERKGAQRQPAAAASDAELDALELSGISMIGGRRMFNLVDSRNQRSFWVALDESAHGFSVVRFLDENDQVVVKRGSFTRTIGLRKPVLVSSAPSKPPAPEQSQFVSSMPPLDELPKEGVAEIKDPKTPDEIKQAEFEARMLVSDLLEISMRERERQRANRAGQQAAQN